MKHRGKVIQSLFQLAACVALNLPASSADAARPNVLFIVADDLRVELGCYGGAQVQSPNIDRLAAQGTLFERAYCQQTVCNPSRASVMTGLRPDRLRVWDLPTHFRTRVPNAVTIPQLFMASGYHAQCVGKIFHNWRQDRWKGDPASWSIPSVLHYNNHGNDKPQVDGELPPNHASGTRGTECRDVPDNAYFDGRVADAAVEALRQFRGNDQPFFLAVGFWKPHTPFNAPKKYWDLYDREAIPIPPNVAPPRDVPDLALTSNRYDDGADSDELREMHHGHLAAISYLDAQVGRVLRELEAAGLRENTIVVFWSDHGLHLGEHGLRAKTTVFELDARVPLIISAPWHKPGQRTRALTELLDIYPTLAELCDLEPPDQLQGASLAPLLRDPAGSVHEVALTQTPRPNYPRGELPEVMGYSIRDERYRYTEWRDFRTGAVMASELYDHQTDPREMTNRADRPGQEAVTMRMARLLDATVDNAAEAPAATDTGLMLDLPGSGTDAAKIDFHNLPRLPQRHAVISDVRDRGGDWVHQHAYLAHYDNRYWAMWSDGPGKRRAELTPEEHRNVVPGHDQPGTRVSYATSKDGLTWSEPADLSGPPRTEGFGWIARGLWVRDGELLALASHFNAPGYPGKGLSLEAFRWNETKQAWDEHGRVFDDTLNNFPPKKLPTGQYMMTRRDHRRQASVMIGGEKSFDQWQIRPLADYGTQPQRENSFLPEEPYWYVLPDGKNLVGLIRDNARSGRLLRTFSADSGQNWRPIVKTNFPDATSKFFVLQTSRGFYAMVSNANPHKRDPLTLAVSRDGLVFTRLFYLVGERHVDYPHVIEHDEHLLIAFSGAKQTVETVKISLDDLQAVLAQETNN